MDVDLLFPCGGTQEFIGLPTRHVAARRRQVFGLAEFAVAIAAHAGPDLWQADNVRPVRGDGSINQAACLGDIIELARARVHLYRTDAHSRLLSEGVTVSP